VSTAQVCINLVSFRMVIEKITIECKSRKRKKGYMNIKSYIYATISYIRCKIVSKQPRVSEWGREDFKNFSKKKLFS